jgi:toxin-antitoxin system PIN domain toxin
LRIATSLPSEWNNPGKPLTLLLDTNILLYAANRDCEEHRRARGFLVELLAKKTPFCLTWSICYEFLRVSTHQRVFPRPLSARQSLRFLSDILRVPEVFVLTQGDHHFDLLREVVAGVGHVSGNFFHDVANAVLAREHSVREIVTADSDYHRFRFLAVTDPIRVPN